MASRSAFGFRSTKQTEKDDKKSKGVSGLSRAPSIASSTPSATKLPSHSSSFFSRSKHMKPKGAASPLPPPPTFTPTGFGESSVSISAIRPDTAKSDGESALSTRSGGASSKVTVQAKSGKPRNVLRRRAGSIEQRPQYAQTESSASSYDPTPSRQYPTSRSSPGGYTDTEPRSILGVTAPSNQSSSTAFDGRGLGLGSEFATSSSHMANFNNRKTNNQSPSTATLPAPTPNYTHDSGSSTKRSESPGAFSRTSTPTSMSSQSPGVPTPAKVPARTRAASPGQNRPPVTWSRFHKQLMHQADNGNGRSTGLSAVRESATSSSSSSTVKPDSRTGTSRAIYNDPVSPRTVTPPPQSSRGKGSSAQLSAFPQRKGSLKYREEQQAKKTDLSRDPSPERSRTAPPRPSREGVPRLDVNVVSPTNHTPRLQPSAPILESRLRPSLEADRSDAESKGLTSHSVRGATRTLHSAASSAPSSRMPSPNPALAPTSKNSSTRHRQAPAIETKVSSKSSKDPSPQSASSTKSSGRFGFFSRRTKSPMEGTAADKATKKGPAAGTGHEGYGKYAMRGRSGSSTTSASRGRSTSSTSIGRTPSSRKSSMTSEHELDDFYRERLAPRAITGGGKTPAGPSDLYLSSSAQSSNNTLESTSGALRTLQMRNDRTESPADNEPAHKLHHMNKRLPQREDRYVAPWMDSGERVSTPTLAARRSLHKSQLLPQTEPVRIPAPINTEASAPSPLGSKDTFQSSVPPTDTTLPLTDDISEGHEGNWLSSKRTAKPKKSPRNWNFFQRSRASPRRREHSSAGRSDDSDGPYRDLPLAASASTEQRQVPFYALMDNSEQDFVDQASSGQQTRRSSLVRLGSFSTNRSRDPSPARHANKESMLLPSPPTANYEFPKPAITAVQPSQPATQPVTQDEIPEAEEPRKPRLQQVGRIPRVVSKRDRLHRPAPQSFSRPRPVTPRQESAPSSAVSQAEVFTDPERPLLGIQTEMLPQKPWDSQDSGKPASAPAFTDDGPDQLARKDEFLAFPPRIGSDVSGSSSSGILSYAAAAVTAVVPGPGAALDEDEVWNEYNEFLDTVQSSASASRERNNPLDKSSRQGRFQPRPLHIRKDSSTTGSRPNSPVKPHSATYPPVTAAPNRDLPSPPKKANLLEPPNTPGTTGTLSDLLANYQRASLLSKHLSRGSMSRYSTSSIESEADSLAGREALGSHARPAASRLTAAQRLSQIYLRRDALLASRWLSFDRVLFSPAHFDMQSNSKDRILVLDGLGNDEWSYYCAENYPNAMVYNLSPIDRSLDPPPLQLPGIPKPPENHKHIHQVEFNKPFPFPQGFFSAAVFRFPTATSDAAYYNAVSEFKRVLRPGGYLELSMLDIDMVNMGNLTRKALRSIKERRHQINPEVSLKPLSDSIQKMLGKKCFENLNRCTLDVPVAGQVNNSRADSFDSASGKVPQSSGERASGSIAKSLAKVGRWWYSSCYEAGLPITIWNDKALLAECEARETGFKLLLCYAQKPLQNRRTRSF